MLLHLVGGRQLGILNIQFKSLKKLKLPPPFREKHGKAGTLSSLKLIHGIIDKAYFCLDTFATLEGTGKSLRFIVCVKLACKSVRPVPKRRREVKHYTMEKVGGVAWQDEFSNVVRGIGYHSLNHHHYRGDIITL